jgi:hypothetical protein
LLAILIALIGTTSASANFYDLLRRVPDSANTIILIDVERMLMSPLAMKEKWRDRGNSSQGEGLHLPMNAKRYLLASQLDFVSNFEDEWDIGLIETIENISLPYLAKAEGGYIDKVEGQEVAFSRRNAFLVLFKPTILGVSFPAKRQALARWIRSLNRSQDPGVSDYLQKAVTLVHGKDQIVVAFDLADVLTSRQVRDRLHRAESLAGKNVDLDALTKVLTSLKGVTLTVEATDRLNAKLRVDFGESTEPLKDVAKVLILEALENHGMLLDDEIKQWKFFNGVKSVTLDGRLSTRGLRQFTNLIPFPAETFDVKGAEAKRPESPSPSDGSSSTIDRPAQSSRKYFQHISQLIDQVRNDVSSAGSPKLARRIVDKAAQEIDRLPVLNVDEELLAYGTGVSATFRNMRNLSKNASLDASYRQATIAGNSGYGYGYGGFYGGTNTQLATSVMRKQETAVLKSNQIEVFTMLEEKTAEIRKKLSVKYHVEF